MSMLHDDRADTSGSVDDIAARMESMSRDIDARVKAALAKKGIPPDET